MVMPRLLSIHAHPDDEASKGAPTVARYVAEGHEAYLVCATGGEEGDIINPVMERPEVRENLAEVRAEELNKSVAAIGYKDLIWLGYRDSGMPETEANLHADCFAAADLDEAVGRFVAILRQVRPHVLLTYSDDQSGYRHPDHLRVHDISVEAFDRAADPDWYPEAGPPWQVQKMYYSMWSRGRMEIQHRLYGELGIKSPFTERWTNAPSQDHRITTKIVVDEYLYVRRQALLAHATQVDPNEKFWFGIPDEMMAKEYPWEDYILARSTVGGHETGSDLFDGVVVETPCDHAVDSSTEVDA